VCTSKTIGFEVRLASYMGLKFREVGYMILCGLYGLEGVWAI
jgi:hypothetical protein